MPTSVVALSAQGKGVLNAIGFQSHFPLAMALFLSIHLSFHKGKPTVINIYIYLKYHIYIIYVYARHVFLQPFSQSVYIHTK